MKNILCFGDSNTWGYDGSLGERFPYEQRWTSLVQKSLGPGYNIIPEGLNGRTTVYDEPYKLYKRGFDFLPVCLQTHVPLDLVVLMLGTNDSKSFFRNTAFAISRGMRSLIEMIQASGSGSGGKQPAILLISPVPVIAGIQEKASFDLREFANLDGHDPIAVSEGLAAEYERKAAEYGCGFLDAAGHADVCSEDGIHLTAGGHRGLAEAAAVKIREMMEE